MVSSDVIKAQLAKTLEGTNFANLGSQYQGKVRDGIVKLLGMIESPGTRRCFPEAIATDPTLRQPALSP